MQVFISYAAVDRDLADQINLALVGAGHTVFFDKHSLPPGGDYSARIREAVRTSDVFVFLISPESVKKGSFALTELQYAREQWPHPRSRVLPVLLRPVPWEGVPPYLRAVTILEPEGNVPAEVAFAVARNAPSERPPLAPAETKSSRTRSRRTTALRWLALLGLLVFIGSVVLMNRQWSRVPGHPVTGEPSGAPVAPPKSVPKETVCVPALAVPVDNAVLSQRWLDNGRFETQWLFGWRACPGATRYHLFVIGPAALNPLIDEDAITSATYQYRRTSFGITHLEGWTWKVRAFVDGHWGDWSEERRFDVAPADAP